MIFGIDQKNVECEALLCTEESLGEAMTPTDHETLCLVA